MIACARAIPEYVTAMTRVLLVEDDPAIGRLLRHSLTESGNAVIVATDGTRGLTLALSEQPDVVLLDLGLPDLDGRQVLTMLRAVSQVPVIVITAQDDDRTVVAALDAGADDYLVKPFGSEQLAARIRAVLRRAAPARPARRAFTWANWRSTPPRGRRAWRERDSTCPARSSTCSGSSRPGPEKW